jgi:NAD(P)H-quinone oxidoreductase subunit 5
MIGYSLITIPLIASGLCFFLKGVSPKRFAHLSSLSIFLTIILALINPWISSIKVNSLENICLILTLYMSLVVNKFSTNYLAGEKNQKRYHLKLIGVTFCLSQMLLSESVIAINIYFLLSNLAFAQLMNHKNNWNAAKQGALFFLKNSIGSFVCLLIASILLISNLHTSNLNEIIESKHLLSPTTLIGVLGFIFLASLIQSGLWPFNKWVLSSLNSVTPVTAFMHAGIITGGGILILRFYELFYSSTALLNLLFILGAISVVLGTLLKLTQNSLKKSLASSTIAQMGFMFIQLGLGLPFAALLHIIFHSLFKAFLFINSPSQINEKVVFTKNKVNFASFILSVIIALGASYFFSNVSKTQLTFVTTDSLLILFVFITSLQICLKLIKTSSLLSSAILTTLLTSLFAFVYGSLIHLAESILPINADLKGTSVSSLHIFVLSIFGVASLIINLKIFEKYQFFKKLYPKLYVSLMNLGLSKSNTVNAVRTEYQN